jgi:hypothetical protein
MDITTLLLMTMMGNNRRGSNMLPLLLLLSGAFGSLGTTGTSGTSTIFGSPTSMMIGMMPVNTITKLLLGGKDAVVASSVMGSMKPRSYRRSTYRRPRTYVRNNYYGYRRRRY